MPTVVVTNDWSGVLIGRIEKRVDKELKTVGRKVAKIAKQLVPIRTGRLKKSIHVEILKTRVKVIADARRKQDNVSYAWWVETGTGRGAAQPFLRPALEAAGQEITEQFSKWKLI